MKRQLEDAQRASESYKAEIKKRDDEIAALQRRHHVAAAHQDVRLAQQKEHLDQEEKRIAKALAELPENYQAFLSRLEEERQELLVEVKELRAKLEERGRR